MKTNQCSFCQGQFEALAYNDHFCSVSCLRGHQQNEERKSYAIHPREGVKFPITRRIMGFLTEKIPGQGRVRHGSA